jgi:hypothetical protein
MADTKITALAAITTVDPAADVLPIVDVSDTSMAASGTTKKITSNQLLGAGGTATLASATITGALTVDTTTLVVNASTDRVGIGTATPARPLDIVGSFQSSLGWVLVGTPAGLGGATRYIGGASTTDSWYYNGLTGGSQIWAFGESTAMTLNSTGLGVGAASPSYKLDVNGVARVNSGGDGLFLSSAAGPDLYIVGTNYYNNNGTEGVQTVARPSWKIEHKNSSDALAYLDIGFRAASAAASAFTSRFKIDGTGQVGIGVTPSAWNATYNVIDIGQNGSISGRTSTNNTIDIVSNGFRNSGGTWVYKLATSNAAARYQVDGSTGAHLWYSGAAGTYNNTIAGFSTASMTLDASGNLIWSPASTPPTLATNGQLTVNATSNTNLRFSYRGSDGTTRVADITLA